MRSFRRNRWRVRDARGAIVALCDAPTIAAAAALRLSMPAEEYRSIRREATPLPRFVMISGVLAAGVGAGILYNAVLDGGLGVRGACLALAACALVVAGVLSFRMRGNADPDLFSEAMLRRGRCPRCTYRIQDCKPDAHDACTVCPECGAAWRVAAVAPVEVQA